MGPYGAARREILPGVEQRQSRYLNNRCEVSHQPTPRRVRHMRRFKSTRQAQRFLSVHDQAANLFRCPAHTNAEDRRRARAQSFQVWVEVTGTARAA
jgi:putative transposase